VVFSAGYAAKEKLIRGTLATSSAAANCLLRICFMWGISWKKVRCDESVI
jgi:hypothetical protein